MSTEKIKSLVEAIKKLGEEMATYAKPYLAEKLDTAMKCIKDVVGIPQDIADKAVKAVEINKRITKIAEDIWIEGIVTLRVNINNAKAVEKYLSDTKNRTAEIKSLLQILTNIIRDVENGAKSYKEKIIDIALNTRDRETMKKLAVSYHSLRIALDNIANAYSNIDALNKCIHEVFEKLKM